jgi:hypothetical protein
MNRLLTIVFSALILVSGVSSPVKAETTCVIERVEFGAGYHLYQICTTESQQEVGTYDMEVTYLGTFLYA